MERRCKKNVYRSALLFLIRWVLYIFQTNEIFIYERQIIQNEKPCFWGILVTSCPSPDQEIGSLENTNEENFPVLSTALSPTQCIRRATTKVIAYLHILRSTLCHSIPVWPTQKINISTATFAYKSAMVQYSSYKACFVAKRV